MIKVYSKPDSSSCEKAKDFLTSIHANYVDFDVVNDRKAREEMIRISGQQRVPVIDINGEIVVGFDKPSMINKLDKTQS